MCSFLCCPLDLVLLSLGGELRRVSSAGHTRGGCMLPIVTAAFLPLLASPSSPFVVSAGVFHCCHFAMLSCSFQRRCCTALWFTSAREWFLPSVQFVFVTLNVRTFHFQVCFDGGVHLPAGVCVISASYGGRMKRETSNKLFPSFFPLVAGCRF